MASSSLVYLHIPKSAGTSHRAYLTRYLGEDRVFWFDIDSEAEKFDARIVGERCVIGGHRPLAFYPRSFDALYSSVVRDPVDRAVSYFNYCTEIPTSSSDEFRKVREQAMEKWRSRGIDPSSMSRSIERCDTFREDISNIQCTYLSRYKPTFEGVMKTLKEENMVVGVFNQMPKFYSFLQEEFDFPPDFGQRTNVGREGYSASIFSERGLPALIRSINVEDQRLFDFLRYEHGGLYVGVNNISSVRDNLAEKPFDWSKIHLFGKGIAKFDSEGRMTVSLMIANSSFRRLIISNLGNESRSIGWQVSDSSGVQIDGLRGTVKINQHIGVNAPRNVWVKLSMNKELLKSGQEYSIEFSMVDGSEWLNQKYPMSSAWFRLMSNE